MAYIYNIKSRDGSKIIATIEIPSQVQGGTVNFDTSTGIASFNPVIMGTTTDTIYWMPNTNGFLGLTNFPNQTTTTLLPNGQSRPLPPATEGTPYDLYEAYDGDEAETGYRLLYDALGGYLTGTTTNPLYNVVSLPETLPSAVKQTVGGGFLALENWCYDEELTDVAYGGEYLNADTTLYAKYADNDITVNVYDNTGNVLKATQTFNGTTSNINVYEILNTSGINIFMANGITYTLEWTKEDNAIFKGLAINPNTNVVKFPIGNTIYLMTSGTLDLYEVYEEIPEPTKYSIIYSTNGGTLEDGYPNPETNLTNVPEYLPTCTKEGYIFDGWYYDISFNNPVVLGAELTNNTVLYAKFTSVLTIDIVLYQNKSENNRVNKKPYLSRVMTMQGTFRQSVDILSPTIIIEAENLPQFNYVFISAFGRYYFVRSITNLNTNVWQISCGCDVLYSYVNTIRSQVAFVARNENEYDPNITDNAFMVNITTSVPRLLASLLRAPRWNGSENFLKDDGMYKCVITMQGVLKDNNNNTIDQPFGLSSVITTYRDAKDILEICSENTTGFSDKLMADLIFSARIFPYEISHNLTVNPKKWIIDGFGGIETPLINFSTGTRIPAQFSFIDTHEWEYMVYKPHRSNNRLQYLNYTPYTTIWVEFMPFGRFEIDPKLLYPINEDFGKITLRTETNNITGESNLYIIYNGQVKRLLSKSNVSFGIPYSGTAVQTLKASTGIITTVASVGSALIAAYSGGLTAPVALATAAGATVGGAQAASALTTPTTTIEGGHYAFIDKRPNIVVETKELVGASYSTMGSPLYKEKKLNTLTGFTQVASVNLQGFNTATAAEVSEIEGLLQSGVIL